jgi:hypothetical protein
MQIISVFAMQPKDGKRNPNLKGQSHEKVFEIMT